jgi:hypothetical protein
MVAKKKISAPAGNQTQELNLKLFIGSVSSDTDWQVINFEYVKIFKEAVVTYL